MMHHGDTDGEIETSSLVWQRKRIRNHGSMRLMLCSDLDEIRGAVTSHDEDIAIDCQVFPIATANIQTDCARGDGL